MKDIIISGKTLTNISKLYFNTEDGKQVCFIEESELGGTPLSFKFQGNSIIGYEGSETDVTIPTSYSKSNIKAEERTYSDFYSLYNDSSEYATNPLPIPFTINNTLEITNRWSVYNYQDQIESWILQDGYVSVKYETFTPVTGNDFEITDIASGALSGQPFTSVRFTKNITLADTSFQNCTSLRDVYFEEDIEFTSDVFKGCAALFRTTTDGAQYIYNSVDNTPYFLQSLLNVTSNSVSILQGTKYIGSDYTSVNSYIQSIYFPSSVKKITDTFPYYNWTALKTLDFSDTQIETLTNTIIYKIPNLTNLYVPYSIKECAASAYNFTSLNTTTYNYGKYIGHRDGTPLVLVGLTSSTISSLTFAPTCRCTCALMKDLSSSTKNTYLKTITLNEGLYTIGDGTFNYFTALSTINWCSTIKKIDGFYHCLGLRNINLPEGLETIGSMAFGYYASTNSRTIHIPSTVKSIGESAFTWSYTSANTAPAITVTVSKDNPIFSDCDSNIIYDKTNDTLIFIPEGGRMPNTTKIIAQGSSSGHGLKQHIYIPESIEEIQDRAFGSPGFTMPGDIDIPLKLPNIKILGAFPAPKVCVFGPNLTTIYSNAIWSDLIEELYFESVIPPNLGGDTGYHKIGNARIYVPYGSLNAYKTAWAGWADRIYEGIYQGE